MSFVYFSKFYLVYKLTLWDGWEGTTWEHSQPYTFLCHHPRNKCRVSLRLYLSSFFFSLHLRYFTSWDVPFSTTELEQGITLHYSCKLSAYKHIILQEDLGRMAPNRLKNNWRWRTVNSDKTTILQPFKKFPNFEVSLPCLSGFTTGLNSCPVSQQKIHTHLCIHILIYRVSERLLYVPCI
jgi:hypothetical protein